MQVAFVAGLSRLSRGDVHAPDTVMTRRLEKKG